MDDFEVMPGAIAEVEARIAEIEGAEKQPNEVSAAYVILQPDAPTRPDSEQDVLGRVHMAPTALQVETNSQTRADALRERLSVDKGSFHIKDSDRYKVFNFIGVAACNSIPRETHRGPARVPPSAPWSP